MSYTHIDVRPMAGALGAEVFGVDLSKAMDDATFDEVHRAFLENLVLFFRGQTLTDEQLAEFGRRFGPLAPLPPHRQHPGKFPELLVIDKTPEDKMVFGW